MDVNKIIGENIRRYRKKKGMTQKDLGKRIGVRHNTISHYESGRNAPEQNMIFEIARALDVRANDLFPETTTKTEDTLKKALLMEKEDLSNEQRDFLRQLIDKALSLDDESREDFLENIRFAIEYFDRKR